MSNPFDDTVADEYTNPFANNNYANDMPAPAPSQSTNSYESTNSNNSSQATQPQASQPKKFNSPFSMGSKNRDTYNDPVTNIQITSDLLDRREAELARRERMIESREQQIRDGTFTPPSTNKNFPPLLRWYSYHPDEELPESARTQAKILFYIYLAIGIVYLVNWIGCLFCLNRSAAQATSSPATKIVLSTIFLFAFYPLSYEVSYFVYYKALAQGKALRFVCFLATYAIWGLFLAFNAIGMNESGSVGWIQTIDMFAAEGGGAKIVAVIGIIFSIAASGLFAFMVFIFIKLIKYYKDEGLEKRTYAEAGQYAAQKANENRDAILDAARENPDAARQIAGAATGAYTKFD
ncbi:hypothetical protein M9Y10_016669 [Tritrichomonas musculus]|uniref:Secretory carrier membrane protein n=1 Tax=Tritrichomonas musculus TaxID=1915356 RepID=A0ABR2HWW5_9EUKA